MEIPYYPQDRAILINNKNGCSGDIYTVTEKVLAKVFKPNNPIWGEVNGLLQEARIGFELYTEGMSVPEPIGIFKVIIPGRGECLAYLMENVGPEDNDPNWPRGVNTEINRCEKLGFFSTCPDVCGNYIYNAKRKKVILIDFQYWTAKPERKFLFDQLHPNIEKVVRLEASKLRFLKHQK